MNRSLFAVLAAAFLLTSSSGQAHTSGPTSLPAQGEAGKISGRNPDAETSGHSPRLVNHTGLGRSRRATPPSRGITRKTGIAVAEPRLDKRFRYSPSNRPEPERL